MRPGDGDWEENWPEPKPQTRHKDQHTSSYQHPSIPELGHQPKSRPPGGIAEMLKIRNSATPRWPQHLNKHPISSKDHSLTYPQIARHHLNRSTLQLATHASRAKKACRSCLLPKSCEKRDQIIETATQCTHGNHPCKTRIHPLPKYPAHHTWPIIYPETSTAPEIPPIAKSSGRPDLNTTIPNHMQPLEPHIPHEARSRFPPSHHGTHNGYTPYIL
jgi:hypothetical protein